MTTDDHSRSQLENLRSIELRTFFIKLVSIFAAIFLFFVLATSHLKSEFEESSLLKGGPEFWQGLERALHKFADSNDIPADKKERIVASLRKISARYSPFIDALRQPEKSR